MGAAADRVSMWHVGSGRQAARSERTARLVERDHFTTESFTCADGDPPRTIWPKVQWEIVPWAIACALTTMLLWPRLQPVSIRLLTSPMVSVYPLPVMIRPWMVTFRATFPTPVGPMMPTLPPSPLLVKSTIVMLSAGGVSQKPLRAPHCWAPGV